MEDSTLFPVPASVVENMLAALDDIGEPLPVDQAAMTLAVDMVRAQVQSKSAYARRWKWSRKTVMRRWNEVWTIALVSAGPHPDMDDRRAAINTALRYTDMIGPTRLLSSEFVDQRADIDLDYAFLCQHESDPEVRKACVLLRRYFEFLHTAEAVSQRQLNVRAELALKYRAIRAAIVARDGELCALCGSDEWIEIDHITPVSRNGTNELDNLQLLCRSCNASKGAKTMSEWSKSNS